MKSRCLCVFLSSNPWWPVKEDDSSTCLLLNWYQLSLNCNLRPDVKNSILGEHFRIKFMKLVTKMYSSIRGLFFHFCSFPVVGRNIHDLTLKTTSNIQYDIR